jgi:hypothetical protein
MKDVELFSFRGCMDKCLGRNGQQKAVGAQVQWRKMPIRNLHFDSSVALAW